MNLDRPETIAALIRNDDITNMQARALREILTDSRNAPNLNALRDQIEKIVGSLNARIDERIAQDNKTR